jgi:hypothetical protein
VTGEASPYYLFHPAIPARVAQVCPEAKLIALLRNPVDRAISHYHDAVKLGKETLPLEEALEAEEDRIAGEAARLASEPAYTNREHFFHSYKSRGIYVDQIKAYEACFPRQQMLIIKSEELFGAHVGVFRCICRFLGIPQWAPRRFRRVNPGGYPRQDEDVRRKLQAFFAPHNRRLFAHLGVEWDW